MRRFYRAICMTCIPTADSLSRLMNSLPGIGFNGALWVVSGAFCYLRHETTWLAAASSIWVRQSDMRIDRKLTISGKLIRRNVRLSLFA